MLDMSDNEIRRLENLPTSHRLGTLLLSNNRINRISADLAQSVPNLHTLVLSNNLVRPSVSQLTGQRRWANTPTNALPSRPTAVRRSGAGAADRTEELADALPLGQPVQPAGTLPAVHHPHAAAAAYPGLSENQGPGTARHL